GAGRTFPPEVGGGIIDDHTPFLDAGIPAIDLIDFDYPHRDTLRDTVDKTSADSLDAVGETVADLLLHWQR
ncbi:MAG TPA: M28 family peptidase, partial [Solirubrobacteraceae bacterium]|nr:M28 family peptidase [Solirubrobacteraceae bacterium]